MQAILNPFDGKVVGHYEPADPAVARGGIGLAAEAFARTRRVAPAERSALLERVAGLIAARAESLAQTILAEAGKPITLARVEVERAVQTFRFAADEAARTHDRVIDFQASPPGKGHRGVAHRIPIGVILGISPFNFPLNLVAHKVAPCIASGNTMVLKPSPRTPLTALALGEILAEAGAPRGQISIMPFDHRLVAGLLEDARVKMLTFTGSAAVGWGLKRLAVKQRVTLELGGNAAVIVHADADWENAIPAIAAGAFGYAGQSCISVQRVLVHAGIYEKFREGFLRYLQAKVITGDPANEETMNGPMIDAAARERLMEWVSEAIEGGAKPALALREEGNCVWPVVLEDVPPNARIAREEAFGPVAILTRYEDFDAALEEVNASRYGLQAGVFTGSQELARRAFERIEAGAVLINQTPTFRVENMPYGGVKESGFGREGVRYAMEEMSEWKCFIERCAR